jgi:hypothetical protein
MSSHSVLLRLAVAGLAASLVGAQIVCASACTMTRAELEFGGVRLGDEASARGVLGPLEKLPFAKWPELANNPQASGNEYLLVTNRDGSELAEFDTYPDHGPRGRFDWVHLSFGGAPSLKSIALPVDHLVTERGIHMGVSERFVEVRLGPCHTRMTAEVPPLASIRYEIEKLKLPAPRSVTKSDYFAVFTFVHDTLGEMDLGFEKP